MKVWIGPAGVPISSKDRSTLGGLKTVAELGLNAMEVEFVRRVGMGNAMAKEVGELAKELGIRLSVHAPYFVNLCSMEKEKLEASKQRILDAAERAYHMGADIVVFHPGFYGKLSHEEAWNAVKEASQDMLDRMRGMGIKGVRLGLETTGKVSQFGELDEVVRICKEVEGCAPVIDFAHVYARAAGKIDYGQIFEKVKVLKLGHLHTHFTGVEFSPVGITGKGNEKHHLELKSNKPPFEPLAKEVLKRKLEVTIISESPILEQDSLIMRGIFEKQGYKF
jgi:deoxyribonuclease-4